MDLDIILWMIGTLFSLGIFAVKVGFGLGFGRMKLKGLLLALSMYIILFVIVAILTESLIKILEPVLKRGPYLHALMAIGMIVWGTLLLRTQKTEYRTQTNLKFEIQNSKLPTLNSSLLLLIPCPVCLTAMTFSTWVALSVIKLPVFVVGLGLGTVFSFLSLLIYFLLKLVTRHSSKLSTILFPFMR